MISDFCLEVAEKCDLLGCYPASSGNFLPTFRDNLSVPSSGFKNPKSFLHFTFPGSQPTHFFSKLLSSVCSISDGVIGSFH